MNMKKILLAGIAVGALASTGANAAALTGVTVATSAMTVSNGVQTQRYTIATKAVIPVGGLVTAATGNTVTVAPSGTQSRFNSGQGGAPVTYAVNIALSGSANPTFAAAVPTVATNTPTTGLCTVTTPAPTNGGAIGGNAAVFTFTVSGTCNQTGPDLAPNAVTITVPFAISAVGDANLTTTFTLPLVGNGTSLYDVGTATANLVQAVNVYDIGVSANPYPAGGTIANLGQGTQLPTVWAAANPALGFNPFTLYVAPVANLIDDVIGGFKVAYVAPASVGAQGLYSNLQGTALPTLAPKVEITTSSSPGFAAMRPIARSTAAAPVVNIAAAGFTVNTANTIATGTGAPIAGGVGGVQGGITANNIAVAAVANQNNSVTSNQAYSLTVTGVPGSAALGASDPVTGVLETTKTQGFRIDAPWFGGSRASTPSLLRLSNSATSATGPVTLILSNATTLQGEALTSTTCTIGTGVPAGQEFLINTTQATSCFGNFVRGDLSVTVLGAVSNLTAKMRVVSGNGSVSEQTLGNVSESVAVNN